MKHVLALVALATAGLSVAAPASAQQYASPDQERARFEAARDRFDREYRLFQQASERYANYSDWLAHAPPPPPRIDARDEGDYEPSRYYRPGDSERVLSSNDRVYRGDDGRYYCKRPDGTTGLIVGAAAGGLFGNVISSRRSSTVGTLLGAIAGGAIGNSVDRNNQMNNQDVRCR
ncbi:Glycine zipper 2TM domain-containing protein [Sphingomonas sp. NFR04]|uniref:glycine zipper 2TM domain-containing protein n=1 Tax=Sphingomonas sp. NFR04 TaxID=1566283 RepID=UPI0008E286CF|nr:glycine zipper 2TM domain-containing protein [Sphingomonas sp. NFR04]SFJ55999.1 Glycine zipper 2TM domain-containing protein [Sphingomonas sp. NFR04]